MPISHKLSSDVWTACTLRPALTTHRFFTHQQLQWRSKLPGGSSKFCRPARCSGRPAVAKRRQYCEQHTPRW